MLNSKSVNLQFSLVYFILADGLRDLHGLLACSLSRPISSLRSGTVGAVENTAYVLKTYFIPTVSDLERAIAGLLHV